MTASAGIDFRHEAGARGEMLNPETFGPGAGWLDADGDGRLDLLIINGNALRGPLDPAATPRLYRNLGGGRFEDVTARSGLALPVYGMGFVSADVDGDGDPDIVIYGLHRSILLKGEGAGRFRDATEASGLSALKGWVGCAAFLDYDRDGVLDLFAGNYVDWSPAREEGVDCTLGKAKKTYCPVALFPPSAPQLFRGRGDGTFEEVSAPAGLSKLEGKALGVAVEDYDRDGWPDLFVANDSVPSFLLRNRGDGTFEERGIASGFATDAGGAALAGMGIDAVWLPDGGPLAFAVGNFSGEPATLHVQDETEYFVERSIEAGVGRATMSRVTFGVLLEDFDLDGQVDLALANGHVFDAEEITRVPYRQVCQLFRGRANRRDPADRAARPSSAATAWRFEEVSPESPAHFLPRPVLGRALACADYDNDGDLDLLLTENQGGVFLLRNDLSGPRRHVRIDLRGAGKSPDALGAEVTLRREGPDGISLLRRTRKASSSYLSQSDRRILVALEPEQRLAEVTVRWPSGALEAFGGLEAGQEALIVEGTGTPRAAAGAAPRLAAGAKGEKAKSSVALRRRGIAALAAGRLSEALGDLEEAIRRDPHDVAAHRARVVALRRAGRGPQLEAALQDVFATFPDAGTLLSQFALVLEQEGEPAIATRLFVEAARLDPTRADTWISLGNLAFDRKAYDEALAHYARALELYPDSVEALVNTGKVHVIQGDIARGVPLLERALAIRPEYGAALSTLGGALIQRGDLERAEALLERALRVTTTPVTLVTIYGNLGILHLRRRDGNKAAAAFEKVLELAPGDRRAMETLERLRPRGARESPEAR